MDINMDNIKQKLQEALDDIVLYPDRDENIRDLHITITNNCELLGIITKEEEKELLKPIEEAIKKYNLCIAKLEE